MPVRSKRSRRLSLIGTLLAIGLVSFFLAVPWMSGLLARFVPAPIEDEAGSRMISGLAENASFCQGDAGLEALDALVDRLARQVEGHAYHVYVVDQPVMNAFAAPGGHIVIFRTIIDEAQTPEEVAGVLAHEMAHVAEGHPSRGLVESLGYGIFGLLTPWGGEGIGAELTQQAITSAYSRDDELDADRRGVEMLNGAGIDSRGLLRFFDRMRQEGMEVPGALEFLSTHPTGDKRSGGIAELVEEGGPALSEPQWRALRQICQRTGEPKAVGT